MKNLVTIAFITTSLFSFGQSEMFWNNYANFNPAMSGFQYSQHAAVTYTNLYPSLAGTYSNVYADYGINIAKNHGVGITYSGNFNSSASHKAIANYNYQFHFKKAGKLAIGVGVGARRQIMKKGHYLFNDSIAQQYDPHNTFEFNQGIAYSWKNLQVGASIVSLFDAFVKVKYIESFPFKNSDGAFNLHAQYAFQIANKFQLTPRILYTSRNGFKRLSSNLTLSYNDQFTLGFSASNRDHFGVNAGWDIKNKLRIAYMFSKTFSLLNNGVSGGVHEFSVAYLIKSKPARKTVAVTPNF